MAATNFLEENGAWRFLGLAIVVISWMWLNRIFIKDLSAIFNSDLPIKNLRKEYIWVFFVGCININFFALFYYMFGIQSGEQVIVGDLATSVYFSIVTWTTLGYGDFSPIEDLRFLAAFESMMGYLYMAVLVGLLLNLTQHNRKSESSL